MSEPVKNAAYTFSIVLFAPGQATIEAAPVLAAGDVTISKDNGTFANITTLPVVTPASSGQVQIDLSATEMNADRIGIKIADQTSPQAWDDVYIEIQTVSGDVQLAASQNNTVTFPAINITGTLNIDDGVDISCSTLNRDGVLITGNGSGNGIEAVGGATGAGIRALGSPGFQIDATANANGVTITGGATSGYGVLVQGQADHGIYALAGGSAGSGINAEGAGGGSGITASGGSSGDGMSINGGTTSGEGLHIRGQASSRRGVYIQAAGANGIGMELEGNGLGAGFRAEGGANGDAMLLIGGTTSGDGIRTSVSSGQGIDLTSGGMTMASMTIDGLLDINDGIDVDCSTTNRAAITLDGNGSGAGLLTRGGATGNGLDARGGATAGIGINAQGAGALPGIRAYGGAAQGGHGFQVLGDGAGDGFNAAGGASGDDIVGDITGNLSGSVGSVTGAVGSVTAAVTVGTINPNVITATSIAAAALNGKGDWNTVVPNTVTPLSAAGVRAAVGLAAANLDTQIGTLATPAQVNAEVIDVLRTDVSLDPAAVPAATASLADKIDFVFAYIVNEMQQTATQKVLRNSADSANLGTATVSDDGTTFTKGAMS